MASQPTPETFDATQAWLRRPELDAPGIHAWELPDGMLWTAPASFRPQMATFKHGDSAA